MEQVKIKARGPIAKKLNAIQFFPTKVKINEILFFNLAEQSYGASMVILFREDEYLILAN